MKMGYDSSRDDLIAAVAARRPEIVERVLVRVRAIGGVGAGADAEYLEGLRRAVATAIDHTIEAAAAPEDRPLQVPQAILAQARLAARRRTPLETVLRRYLAGHAVLGDLVAEEAERRAVAPALLRRVLRAQAAETDRVLAVISGTYRQEAESARPVSGDRRRTGRVRRLLDGELLDPAGLGYDLERWHVGMVARGPAAGEALAALTAHRDATRLIVPGDDGLLWAWLGFRERPDPLATTPAPQEATGEGRGVGIGEPARGRPGWRLTHEQAHAALSVAARGGDPVVRYADVALLAAALRDELLVVSLRSLYLDPLDGDGGNGEVLRRTLRAYLDADRNVSSAAAALGVNRNTVTNRLRTIEMRIGHLRPSVLGSLSLALQLDDQSAAKRQN
jgi:PucR C-terminal helix-turn-helix domain/GGDEF-like domain